MALALTLGLCVGAGDAAASATPRVVDGVSTSIATAPFTVALYTASTDVYDGQFCGGVIIDATHVITAAHCLSNPLTGQPPRPGEIAVLAGASALATAGEPQLGFSDPVTQTSFDPNWDPQSGNDDVGIVTLAQPLWSGPAPALDGTSTIAPIPLISASQAGDESPGTTASVFGWGYDQPVGLTGNPLSSGYPQQLQSAALTLISNGSCSQDLESLAGPNSVSAAELCASSPPSTDASSCYGDSGGPLVVTPGGTAPDGDLLIGLVDLGYGCAVGYPNVFTSVDDPGVQVFLNSAPPQAPYLVGNSTPSIGGSPTLTCGTGSWVGNPLFAYQFYTDEGGGQIDQLTAPQSSPSYTLPTGGLGVPVFCVVFAENAGGFALGRSADITPGQTSSTTTTSAASTTSSLTTTSAAATTTASSTTTETTTTTPPLTTTSPVATTTSATTTTTHPLTSGATTTTTTTSSTATSTSGAPVGQLPTTFTSSGSTAGYYSQFFAQAQTPPVPATTTTTSTSSVPKPRPALRVLSHGCVRRRCTVLVLGEDAGGPGVRTVKASVQSTARRSCRRRGRRATCSVAVVTPASVEALSHGRFQVRTGGLPIGQSSLTLVAVDRAGLRESPATVVALAVSR